MKTNGTSKDKSKVRPSLIFLCELWQCLLFLWTVTVPICFLYLLTCFRALLYHWIEIIESFILQVFPVRKFLNSFTLMVLRLSSTELVSWLMDSTTSQNQLRVVTMLHKVACENFIYIENAIVTSFGVNMSEESYQVYASGRHVFL